MNDCLLYTSSQVFPGGALINQGLYVGFCKHTAAGRNGVDGFIMFRIIVKAGGVCLQQGSHLVNKRTGASRADSVHSLVDASGEINDFCVLAPQLDGDIGLRSEVQKRGGNGHHLLDKGNLQTGGERESSGTGYDRDYLNGAGYLTGFF